ncbi:Protein WAX2 [Triticum urartu]|uniref:aldehyde oxygenase (deformylating) n=1 Tax=Triticum urartu TaxID=4572 RepID=M7ZGE1_TRIUA|nr:Protein WAX2 [Triticum urartu]
MYVDTRADLVLSTLMLQYVLYGPLVAQVAQAWREQGGAPTDSWCLHLLLLLALRSLTHQLWFSYANMLFFTRRRRVVPDGVDFRQIDAEWDWDNMVIMQTLLGAMAISSPVFPAVSELRAWDPRGWAVALLLHVAVSEPGFRWAHRALHRAPLFSQYHSKHHSSPVTQPLTSAYGTPLESLVLTLAMAAPLAGAVMAGVREPRLRPRLGLRLPPLHGVQQRGGHLPQGLPGLPPPPLPHLHPNILHRFVSTASTKPNCILVSLDGLPLGGCTRLVRYLSLHHQEKDSNFCLFMPLFDLLGGTVHPRSWELQKEVDQGKNDRVPDFVFLAHVVDVVSSMHVPFAFRACSSQPWTTRLVLLPLWPVAFCLMVLQVLCSKTFTVSFYCLRGALHQTWTIPRYSFQYFIPPMKDGINRQIELAILRADRMGVKVLSLAALNKNEALNGGGTLFVDRHPDLRVRVVHGNTLTAAVILHEIPGSVKEVFLTGATSKLGRAIALYLCRKKIRVLMLTLSSERFLKIQREAPAEFQQYLSTATPPLSLQELATSVLNYEHHHEERKPHTTNRELQGGTFRKVAEVPCRACICPLPTGWHPANERQGKPGRSLDHGPAGSRPIRIAISLAPHTHARDAQPLFVTDCLEMMKNVKENNLCANVVIIKEFLVKQRVFGSAPLLHNKRSSNCEAHNLVKAAVSLGVGHHVWLTSSPSITVTY